MDNLKCENFKKNIEKIITECELPPVVVYYILKDALRQVQDLSNKALEYEYSHFQENIKTEKKIEEEA